MVGDHFGQGAVVLLELAPKGCDAQSGYGRSLPGTACASSLIPVAGGVDAAARCTKGPKEPAHRGVCPCSALL